MNTNCDSKICGIKCEVSNCKYHTEDNCCAAGSIKVGPMSAQNSCDTACDTFEKKF